MAAEPKPIILNEDHDVSSLDSQRVEGSNCSFLWRFYEAHYPPGFLKKVIAEVIATFLLVFVTCGAAALSASDEHRVSHLGASIAGGLIVTVMIYAVGHISGAHMNPAITLAFAAVRRFPLQQVPIYALAQLTGATVASFTLRQLLHPITRIGIWVYFVGPVMGTLLGAWSYNFIRVSDKPVHAISLSSFSFKLRRSQSNDGNTANKDQLDNL